MDISAFHFDLKRLSGSDCRQNISNVSVNKNIQYFIENFKSFLSFFCVM